MSEMYSLALYRFDIPGESGFPLNSVYAKPSSTGEAGNNYIEWLILNQLFKTKYY